MKQRFVTLSIVLTMVLSTLVVVSGCGREKAGVEVNALKMLPENASGVIVVNFQKLAQLEFFDKMIKEAEEKPAEPGELFESYQDFVNKTGIDLKKDVSSVAVAIMGKIAGAGKADPDMVVVASLNYDKNKIMALVKEKGGKLTEETYNNVPVFKFKEDGKEKMFSFVSDNLAALGVADGVKKVIDLSKGTGKSVMDNEKMKPFLNKLKSDAVVSLVIEFPEEAKKVQESGMFKMDLSKAEAILGFIDYANKAWNGEFQLISHNEEGNQQLVSTLNGFKMMGGAAGPEVAELLEKITFSATADSVKLEMTIPDELVEKLRKKMEEKTKETITPPETETETE
ncbi:MAG: hypothetical protein GTO45_14985 [Candidatus Aminicenantes bacterium]|nr:hypothetical protein [Candidatus Aminicenantes bacterium]NIM80069.1 hypothetical protein [Candidatus Aminicenantes bacterium]NIN19412.1 hypothetical protein [Candidatus Aminicenantes bacterium]NIN43311.1 hypothetical protein [Candidatus Aminicenantes bacterium]NIN86055.1 hypothetical protein [Candidatus Aminicenantes bacterium]